MSGTSHLSQFTLGMKRDRAEGCDECGWWKMEHEKDVFHCSDLCGLKILRAVGLRARCLKLDALAASTENFWLIMRTGAVIAALSK